MELIMLVGIPGSGKSTVAAQYIQRGYHVHASDEIRREMFGEESIQKDPSLVFNVLHQRIRSDLNSGISCVMDATNMSRKRRMNFLRDMGNVDCIKRCVLLLVPPEECMRRNAARSRTVEDSVFGKMLRAFECPDYCEGWDIIEPVASREPYRFPFDRAMTFSQDNPHHTLTLGEHMAAAEAWCRGHGCSEEVCEAARYHDIGKYYTKQFCNSKGIPTETAHYYGHEGYSAYLYLCEMAGRGLCRDGDWKRTLYIANLISMHMKPLNVWKNSPSAHEKARCLIGEHTYEELMQLHEADVTAH